MKHYYCVKLVTDTDCRGEVGIGSEVRLGLTSLTICKASINDAVLLPSDIRIVLRKRKNSSEFFLNLTHFQNRFWFGELQDLIEFYFSQGIDIEAFNPELSSGIYCQAFFKKTVFVSLNGVNPINIKFFPEDVDVFYDPGMYNIELQPRPNQEN